MTGSANFEALMMHINLIVKSATAPQIKSQSIGLMDVKSVNILFSLPIATSTGIDGANPTDCQKSKCHKVACFFNRNMIITEIVLNNAYPRAIENPSQYWG